MYQGVKGTLFSKGKGNVLHVHAMKAYGGSGQLHTLLTSALDGTEGFLHTSAALPMRMALKPVTFKRC
jgi:hypothetical protein